MDTKEKLDLIYEKVFQAAEDGILTEEEAGELFTGAAAAICLSEEHLVEESRRDSLNGLITRRSLGGVIKDAAHSAKKSIKMAKRASGSKSSGEIVERKLLTPDEYAKLLILEAKLRKDLNWPSYNRNFQQFRNLLGLRAGSLNVRRISKQKEDDGKFYSIQTRYSVTPHSISLPEGYALYHFSSKSDLKKLFPSFKGKRIGEDALPHMNGTGDLYSAPRVYFQIRPTENPLTTGYDPKKTKVERTRYTPMYPIKNVFVDSNMPSHMAYLAGAVYVETDRPIPVVKIS